MTRVDATNQLGWGIQAIGPGYSEWTFSFTERYEDGSEKAIIFPSKTDAEEALKESMKWLDKRFEFRVYPVLKGDV